MITDALGAVFVGLFSAVVGLLPDGDPIGIGSFTGIWVGYSWLNTWLPLSEVVTVFGLWLGLQVAIYAWLGVRALWAMVPFKFS